MLKREIDKAAERRYLAELKAENAADAVREHGDKQRQKHVTEKRFGRKNARWCK